MIVGAHRCAGSHRPPNERKLSALQQTSELTNKAHKNQQLPAGLYARIETAAHRQKRTKQPTGSYAKPLQAHAH